MALGGLFGSTAKLAAHYQAQGHESASDRKARKEQERDARRAPAPSPEALARAADWVAGTPESADRRRTHRRSSATHTDRAGQAWDDAQRRKEGGY